MTIGYAPTDYDSPRSTPQANAYLIQGTGGAVAVICNPELPYEVGIAAGSTTADVVGLTPREAMHVAGVLLEAACRADGSLRANDKVTHIDIMHNGVPHRYPYTGTLDQA